MNKRMITAFTTMYLGAAMSMDYEPYKYDKDPIDLERQKRNKKRAMLEAEIRNNEKKGLKGFQYDSNVLWARNQKNADRKAKNKGWI